MRFKAPATTANLGSGFDVLGMALELHNEVQFERADRLKVACIGKYATQINDARNLFELVFAEFEKATGKRVPPANIIQECAIPPARGLGSSAAALASALFIANVLTGASVPTHTLLKLGTEIEGHPDNIVPCMLGGLTVSYYDGKKLDYEKFEVSKFPLVFLIPNFTLSTEEMRQALPSSVPLTDALVNLKTLALFISRVSKGKLAQALLYTRDALHQPYRMAKDERMRVVLEAVKSLEPDYWFVSGSGSAVCCEAIKIGLSELESIPHLESVLRTAPANEPFILKL